MIHKPSGTTAASEPNSVQQGRSRARAEEMRGSAHRLAQAPPAAAGLETHDSEKGEAASPDARRGKPTEPEETTQTPDHQSVPDHIRRRFVQIGRKYYFPDGARAFTDRGHRLTTASENTEIIKSLIDIAKARGWDEVVVKGSERFRREAWMSGRMAGIEVRGYRASEFEESKLVRILGEKPNAERRAAALPREDTPQWRREERVSAQFVGKLLEHGRAPYKQDPKEPMSYFARIQTERGERTVWGVDLERAFKESHTQPKTGDVIGLMPARKDPVRITVAERGSNGEVSHEKSIETHRNRWLVEKQAFFDERARAAQILLDRAIAPTQAVKDHPELVGPYLQVKAAELAARKFRNQEDRGRFVEMVRGALANSVASGEPLPKVRLKGKAPPRRAPRSSDREQAR
jgi:putative DNA primase/helicase